jgi:hypothetical protein
MSQRTIRAHGWGSSSPYDKPAIRKGTGSPDGLAYADMYEY